MEKTSLAVLHRSLFAVGMALEEVTRSSHQNIASVRISIPYTALLSVLTETMHIIPLNGIYKIIFLSLNGRDYIIAILCER